MTDTLTKAALAHFTGTMFLFRHNMMRDVLYTDGVKYVAEKGGAYWLIDEIAFAQLQPKVKEEEFQFWILRTDLAASMAILTCENGNGNVVYNKPIEYTDFPLDEISFYFTNSTLLLPSEN